jgi:hypothetical protein
MMLNLMDVSGRHIPGRDVGALKPEWTERAKPRAAQARCSAASRRV